MLSSETNQDASEALKATFRRHASGVAVITTTGPNGEPVGFTATSVTSLGSNPALFTFNVARGASSWEALSKATHVAMHTLGKRNLELARKMAADHSKRFSDKDWEFDAFGLPVFFEASSVLFGKIREYHNVEQNAVFVVEVLSGKTGSDDSSLLYSQRNYFTPAEAPL